MAHSEHEDVGVASGTHREWLESRVPVASPHRVEVLRRVRPEEEVGPHKIEPHRVVARGRGDLREDGGALAVEAEAAVQERDERDEQLRDRRVAREDDRLAAEERADLRRLKALEL